MTDNELIAEFMDWRESENNGISPQTSWDWLMPVIEKIQEPEISKIGISVRTAANVYIYYKACRIEYSGDEESGDYKGEWGIQTKGKTKIEAAYKAVVKFIKWYNQQNQ